MRGGALRRTALRLALLGGAVAPFANSLNNEWVYDDRAQVVRNELVRSLNPGPIFARGSVSHGDVEWYRPLAIESLALNYSLSDLDPLGYHATNVALHTANTFLVLKVGERLAAPGPGALAAALFAVHAVHTEAVTPVSGRADLLAAAFVLFAWWLTLGSSTSAWSPPAIGTLFFAGLLSTANAVALLPLVAAGDILGRPVTLRRPVYAALFCGLAAYVAVRYAATGGTFASGTIRYMENPLVEVGAVSRVVTGLWIVIRYVSLFLMPHPLSADYSYDQISAIAEWRDPRLLAVVLGVVFTIGVTVWFWRRSPRVALCLLAFLVLLAPVANIVFPIGTIMAERLLYLPSVPLCLLAGLAGAWGVARGGWRKTFVFVTVALALAVNFAVSVARNRDWRSDEALFAATVRDASRSAKAHFNYGSLLLEKRDVERAEPLLRRAAAIAPVYPEAHNLLGAIHLSRGELVDAERAFRAALRDAPDYAPALGNLGMTLVRQSRWEEAEVALRQAVARDPGMAAAYVNLGFLAEIRGDLAKAIALNRRAYALDPSLEVARSRAEELASKLAK